MRHKAILGVGLLLVAYVAAEDPKQQVTKSRSLPEVLFQRFRANAAEMRLLEIEKFNMTAAACSAAGVPQEEIQTRCRVVLDSTQDSPTGRVVWVEKDTPAVPPAKPEE